MIFDRPLQAHPRAPFQEELAEQLAGRIREFKGSRAEDAWLFAAWERNNDEEKGWSFRYFTIDDEPPGHPLPVAIREADRAHRAAPCPESMARWTQPCMGISTRLSTREPCTNTGSGASTRRPR